MVLMTKNIEASAHLLQEKKGACTGVGKGGGGGGGISRRRFFGRSKSQNSSSLTVSTSPSSSEGSGSPLRQKSQMRPVRPTVRRGLSFQIPSRKQGKRVIFQQEKQVNHTVAPPAIEENKVPDTINTKVPTFPPAVIKSCPVDVDKFASSPPPRLPPPRDTDKVQKRSSYALRKSSVTSIKTISSTNTLTTAEDASSSGNSSNCEDFADAFPATSLVFSTEQTETVLADDATWTPRNILEFGDENCATTSSSVKNTVGPSHLQKQQMGNAAAAPTTGLPPLGLAVRSSRSPGLPPMSPAVRLPNSRSNQTMQQQKSTIGGSPVHLTALEIIESTRQSTSPQESCDHDSLADLDKLISETSERWQKSASLNVAPASEQHRMSTTTTSTEHVRHNHHQIVPMPPREQNQLHLCDDEAWQDDIIARQQAEIDNLRMLLQQQQRLEQPPGQLLLQNIEPQESPECQEAINANEIIEQIDDIPVEQIEVCDDAVSVASGLTNFHHDIALGKNDSFFLNASITVEESLCEPPIIAGRRSRPDAASITGASLPPTKKEDIRFSPAGPPPRPNRPDAASMTGASLPPAHRSRHANGMELELTASDGSKRRATYTGTVENGKANGMGVMLFETGDMYVGQVVNNEMHGQGTYSFKRKSKKSLEGTFVHNVYTGWDPESLE